MTKRHGIRVKTCITINWIVPKISCSNMKCSKTWVTLTMRNNKLILAVYSCYLLKTAMYFLLYILAIYWKQQCISCYLLQIAIYVLLSTEDSNTFVYFLAIIFALLSIYLYRWQQYILFLVLLTASEERSFNFFFKVMFVIFKLLQLSHIKAIKPTVKKCIECTIMHKSILN